MMNSSLRARLEPLFYRFIVLPLLCMRQYLYVRKLRREGRATVVFIVSSLPQWRSQPLFDLLFSDPRFAVSLVLYPFPSFGSEQVKKSVESLCSYCNARNIPYLDLSDSPAPGTRLRNIINPDIIFYPQPYNFLFGNDLDAAHFKDKLLCYIPYAIHTFREPIVFQNILSYLAWRMFFMTEDNKKEAGKVLYNHARNFRIVGDSISDLFSAETEKDPWKQQEKRKKRVIWAPHFTIDQGTWLHRDSFTWLSELMIEISVKYQDSIQFAFKPHPRLFTELQKHPDWGTEKALAYYQRWSEGTNTQLETGPYVDLFKTSNAMIHDSGSFSVEYHFTGNPVLFTSPDVDAATHNMNDLGRDAVLAHYHGCSEKNIRAFIEEVVLGGKDPMRETREYYYNKYLRPPGGRSVAENIYQEILSGLHFVQ